MDMGFSSKKMVGGLVLVIVVGWVAYRWWFIPQQSPVDDSGLIPTSTSVFQPQMDEIKIKEAVKSALIQNLSGVNQSDIEVININPQQWPDACLGIKREGEVCAQVITPGYKVKVLAAGQIYEVRTNQSLEQVAIINSNGEVIN